MLLFFVSNLKKIAINLLHVILIATNVFSLQNVIIRLTALIRWYAQLSFTFIICSNGYCQARHLSALLNVWSINTNCTYFLPQIATVLISLAIYSVIREYSFIEGALLCIAFLRTYRLILSCILREHLAATQ